MLLYTIIPYEEIFPPECDMQLETKPIHGGFVELVKTKEGRHVSRVISTDLRMYLKGPKPGERYC